MKGFLNLVLKSGVLTAFVMMHCYIAQGQSTTTYGYQAGTNGTNNSFFGAVAGANNTGMNNAFFGYQAGLFNTSGYSNSFYGTAAGERNTTGRDNSFFGSQAGLGNLGSQNAFFGNSAGYFNSTGYNNSFFGVNAGKGNWQGHNNTAIGFGADVLAVGLTNANAIGSSAAVSQSNSLVLGSIAGVNGAPATVNVGIGTTAPQQTLHVNGNSEILSTGSGSGFKFRNRNSTTSSDDWVWYSDGNVARFWRSGVGDLLTVKSNGSFAINTMGVAGFSQLCRNGFNEISNCSSSIRYKSNVTFFTSGLDLIKQLRPVSFNWTQNDLFDFGLVAEEVAEVEPLLATYNNKGEVEGVKYDRVGVVLVNAVNEQQTQIESQQKQISEQTEIIKHQQTQLEALKTLVCSQNPTAEICQ